MHCYWYISTTLCYANSYANLTGYKGWQDQPPSLIRKEGNRLDRKKRSAPGISFYEMSAVSTDLLDQALKVRSQVIRKIIPLGFTKGSHTSPVLSDSVGANEQNTNITQPTVGALEGEKLGRDPHPSQGPQVSLQTLCLPMQIAFMQLIDWVSAHIAALFCPGNLLK